MNAPEKILKIRPYYQHSRFRSSQDLRSQGLRPAAGVDYTPKQLAAFYGLPTSASVGAGKKIAVIELGGGFDQAALTKYFAALGYPSVAPVVFHAVQGAANNPTDSAGDYVEVMLDLCVAGGMAPGAQLHCYMAPNTDAGFLAAVNQAISDKMDCISISWGGPEDAWTSSSLAAFNAAFQSAAAAGIVVTCASGDNGSTDGETGPHVDFPASSPHVLGCGGTSLPALSPSSEVVWNDGRAGGATGGGVSTQFALPSFQAKAGVPGGKMRGVPDVAGCADPNTGWAIVVDSASGTTVVGGTSAVAPLWAAVAAYLMQNLGKNVVGLGALLYGLAGGAFRDITSGNNGTYAAKAGFDCCTGLGAPVVAKLLAALAPTAPTPPAPPSPPAPVSTTRDIKVTGTGLVVTVDGKTI